jgi:Tfp pilus assembly protein FimT
MLIVVTILGILASVILPSMNSTSSVIGLEAAARTLAADLRIARQSAVQYNSSYQVKIDLTANTYQIVFVGTGTVPTLTNLLGSSSSNGNSIDFDQWSASRLKQARVALAGAALKTSKANVTDVTFGPAGGTGPTRTEDTVFWLTQGSNDATCRSAMS